jgi:hypothetical protein
MIALRRATISAIASVTSRGPAAVPAAVSATSDGRNRSASFFGIVPAGHRCRKWLLTAGVRAEAIALRFSG